MPWVVPGSHGFWAQGAERRPEVDFAANVKPLANNLLKRMMMHKRVHELVMALYYYMAKQTQRSQHQIVLFGVVMMINFPLFGVLWKFDAFQLSEEFFLRIIATTLCAILAFNPLWPKRWIKLFPVFWYLAITYTLPFFFTYSTLLNHGSTNWLMNSVSAIFFLLLLLSVLDALVVLILGSGLGVLIYFYIVQRTFEYSPGSVSLFSLLITYTAAIVIGSLFARDREIAFAGQVSGIRSLAGSLAEDLRTPLDSIYQQAELQEIILNKLNNPEARRDLKASLDKITRGVENSKQLINLQLNTMQQETLDTSGFKILPMKILIQDTLDDYPLNSQERSLLEFDTETDFTVWVDDVAFKSLLWNVLKQHYEPYRKYGHTDLTIWMTRGEENDDFNYLHVKSILKSRTNIQKELSNNHLQFNEKKSEDDLVYSMLFLVAARGQLNVIEKSERIAYVLIKFPKVE